MSLLERESYIQSLNACLERVAAGTGWIALVAGEAGIGKTALLRQFASAQASASYFGMPPR